MDSLKRIAISVTLLLSAGVSDISSAQYTLNPRSVTQLSEVLDDARREWTYTIQAVDEYDRGTSLSDAGLVFVTGDSDIIQTIDRDGTIVWERRSPEGMGTVSAWASPNGRYVYLVHRTYDEGGIFELITSDGQTLWTKDLTGQGWPQFSRDGEYILPDPNILFPQPIEVIEARTGFTSWRKDGPAVKFLESGSDHMVYIENNTISNVALPNGQTLWTHSFDVTSLGDEPGFVVWRMKPSKDGKKLAVAVQKHSNTRIGVIDPTGNLLWRQDVDGTETPWGITPDGRFLASKIDRPGNRQLKLVDADTGTVIWRLQAGVYGRNAVIMNNRLIFNTAGGVLILTIDSSGLLRDQMLLPRKSIEYVGLRSSPDSSQNQTLQLTGRSSSQNQTLRGTVLLLKDVQSDRTFFIETIER